jgi:hypothetical protein
LAEITVNIVEIEPPVTLLWFIIRMNGIFKREQHDENKNITIHDPSSGFAIRP